MFGTKGLEILKNDTDKKTYFTIIKELLHCAVIEKEIPHYYFRCLLYKKGSPDYRKFIGNRKREKIIHEFYFKDGSNYDLEDKLAFSKLLEENSIRTPKILASNDGYKITLVDEIRIIQTAGDLTDFLKQLLYRSKANSVFVKRKTGLGGLHTFKFDTNKIGDENSIKKLFELMESNDFLFQETVIQHDRVNEIYSGSLNTVRVHAAIDGDNKVELISALMRFGSHGSVVDNGSSGGFFVPVNIDNWTLEKTGSTFFENGSKRYIKHPDTGYEFNNFEIPFGNEIKSEINKAAKLFDTSFIGWDIAITKNGPLIIEGNENPHVNMAQMACGGFKGHAGFEKVFAGYL